MTEPLTHKSWLLHFLKLTSTCLTLQKSYDVDRKSITILEDVPYSLTLVTTSLYIGNHVQKPLVLLQKWLPRWEGPYQITERLPNSDNYRLKHVDTGKVLDPTNVDKLVRVEPWSKSDQQSNATNHELSSQDVSPSPTPSPDEDVEIGQFVIFERRGENTKDDEMQTLLKTVFDFLNENNGKISTGEVCKYLYSKNAEYRKLIKSRWN